MKNVALITGASSGLGKEFAYLHAEAGGDMVLVARRIELLNDIKADIEAKHNREVMVIQQDLAVKNAGRLVYDAVKEAGVTIEYLINNAGFGGHGKFAEANWSHDEAMMQVNMVVLSELTHLYLQDMLSRNRGKILNIASIASFMPGPLQATYYATKAFVLSLTEALAVELDGTGVSITALCPGLTETDFIETANMNGIRGTQLGMASARSVAAYGYQAMNGREVIAIPGVMNKAVPQLKRILPRRLARIISHKAMQK